MPKYTPDSAKLEFSLDEIPYGFCHCGCGQKTQIAKHNDKWHGYTKGEPRRFVSGHNTVRPASERLWEKVDKNGPIHPMLGTACWEWKGSITAGGYGNMGIGKKTIPTHRFSWELHNGPIPDGLLVCHKCDNRPCCNPTHLFIGTNNDNAKDMFRKGRQAKGENHPKAILTEDEVREIRQRYANGESPASIARSNRKVAPRTVHSVISHENWKHID